MTFTQGQVWLIDSDRAPAHALSTYLRTHGFHADVIGSARELHRQMQREEPDVILLDLRTPRGDGMDVLSDLRRRSDVPIIALDAQADAQECVLALELGADDYLRKPANPRELLARIRALHRRRLGAGAENRTKTYVFAQWTFEPATRRLAMAGVTPLRLTPGECRLLLAFVQAPFTMLSRHRLLRLSGEPFADSRDRSIDLRVWRLRRRFGTGNGASLIRTERNIGFIFNADVNVRDV
jgi:two-component system phosphate regulon response regulator OmpR